MQNVPVALIPQRYDKIPSNSDVSRQEYSLLVWVEVASKARTEHLRVWLVAAVRELERVNVRLLGLDALDVWVSSLLQILGRPGLVSERPNRRCSSLSWQRSKAKTVHHAAIGKLYT